MRCLLSLLLLAALPSIAAAQFTDVTADSLGDAGPTQAVAWGDYDGDGDLDLYLANFGQPNRLLRNDGGGTFVDVTTPVLADSTGDGTSAAWADHDNDGDLDLYVCNSDQANRLFRNDGGGTFADVGNAGSGLGGGTLNGSDTLFRGAWGDYDNDGLLDLYVVAYAFGNVLLRNDGGDAFYRDIAAIVVEDEGAGFSATWGDYDDDGDLDLYLTNGGLAASMNRLFRNDGGGAFADVTAGPLGDIGDGAGAAWGDHDNDGDLDLYLTNDGANRLFRNDGGTFVDATSGPLGDAGNGTAGEWGDYDNDGDLDLFLSNSGESNRLLRNDGAGTFVDVTAGALADTGGTGVAWGDYDDDGDLDLYLANGYGSNRLLRNDVGTANHWLQVDLEGTVSNRAGIGARVRVVAGGLVRIVEISGGSGWGSQNPLRAHFGLGGTTTIDSLTVSWPSGILQTITPTPAVDQRITVVEAATVGMPPGGETGSPGLLLRAHPNPSPGATRISFTLDRAGPAAIEVLDVKGRRVTELLQRPLPAGPHQVTWDGRDAAGRAVPGGIYFLHLEAGGLQATHKVVRLDG